MTRLRNALAIAITGALLGGEAVGAEAYPTKPVRIVLTISAGSTADILARTVAEPLSRQLGEAVVIENRPGAGGNVAGAYVAREAPDGHTLLLATISSHGINPSMYGAKMPYDALGDFTPIIAVASVPSLLIASPAIPATSVTELVSLAKSKPGELAYSSGGVGTSHHLAAELFNSMAQIKTLHVPYRGTPEAVTAVVRGDAAFMFPNAPNADTLAREGQVKALAATSPKRLRSLPEVPTMIELGYTGFEVVGWYGLVAPKGTPEHVVKRLNTELNEILKQPAVIAALEKTGFDVMGGTPEEFRTFNRAEIQKWGDVVARSGAKVP